MHTVPLTPGQLDLWLLDQRLGDEMPLITRAAPLGRDVDLPALERALRRVAARHAALRTLIEIRDGRPVQVVSEEVCPDLLRFRADDRAERDLAVLLEEQRAALSPLDLTCTAPIRMELVHARDTSILVATAHPLVADERSLAVLLGELDRCYRAELTGGEPSLAPSASYASYVAPAVAPAPGLPADRERARPHSGAGLPGARSTLTEAVALQLEAPVGLGLEALARDGRGSLAAVLAACLAAVRCRYDGTGGMTVGLVVDTRTADGPAVIGPCSALIALDIDVPPARDGRGCATAVVRDAVERVAHAQRPDLPALHPGGARAARRLVPDAWVEEDVCSCTHLARLAGLGSEAAVVRRARAIPRLRLLAHRRPEGLALALEYHQATSSREAAVQLLEGVAAFAGALVDAPNRPVRAMPAISARHRAMRVQQARGPSVRGGDTDAVAVLWRAADHHRDAEAIVEDGVGRRTYGELVAEADDLAGRLRGLGVERDSVVALTGPRSIGLVVGMLAILRAGGAVLALDPGYPPERLGYMLRDSGARLLLAGAGAEHVVAVAGDVRVLRLPADGAVSDRAPLPDRIDPRQLAYVVYTSGSTGHPKGVLIEHRSLANQLTWLRDELGLGPCDRVPYKFSLGFDAAFSELLGTLSSGATVVVAGPGGERDAGYLLDLCARHEVTALNVTPTYLEALLRHPGAAGLRTLRMVLSGGEELTRATVDRCRAATGATLYNLYGPAETTINAAFHRISDTAAAGTTPIGRPVANTRAHVLGPDLEPVPVGAVGEIYIGGIQVARGYTRGSGDGSRFVPDHLAGAPGSRLYRSGDLGRVHPDGWLEFVGRVDRQVQVRGQRVEPTEIEAVLASHPVVRQCAVVAARTPRVELHGYVVASEPLRDAGGLRAYLRERLPEAMVPARFYAVDELPRLASGKLERHAIARLQAVELAPNAPSRAPLTGSEAAIARAFGEVLGRDAAGVGDSFFDLGGDSLQAVALVVRLEELLGRAVEIRDVFEAPSPALLADRLEDVEDVVADLRLRPLPGVQATHRPRPASAAQRAILGGGLGPADPDHHVRLAVRLPGDVDEAALRTAVQLVVERHGSLRTALLDTPDGWQQVVAGGVGAEPEVHDVPSEGALEPTLRDLAARPFDLAEPPLARFALVRTASTGRALLIVIHRAVADRSSVEIVLRDLSRYLFHLTDGCALPTPLATGYAEYSRWLDDVTGSGVLDAQRAHWRVVNGTTAAAPRARSAAPKPSPTTIGGPLDPAVALALRALAGRSRLSLAAILRAGLYATLQREDELPGGVLGLPDGGRRGLRALDGVVGPFDRLLPIRPRATAVRSLTRLVGEMRRQVAAARANALGAAGLEHLQRSAVSFEQRTAPPLREGTVELMSIGARQLPAGVDLDVEATVADETIHIAITERTGAWQGRPASAIDDAYRALLRQMARGEAGTR